MRWAAWERFLLRYACTIVGVGAFWYVTGNPNSFYVPFRDKYIAHLGTVWLHGVPAVLALLIGPWQFSSRRPAGRHRLLGLVYLMAMLLASVTGFEMGLVAFGGMSSQAGFCLMAVLWAWTGMVAWRRARLADLAGHALWMRRNFALTLGALLLRVYLTLFQWGGLDFFTVYPYVTWLAWVPNLLWVEVVYGCLRQPLRRWRSSSAPMVVSP